MSAAYHLAHLDRDMALNIRRKCQEHAMRIARQLLRHPALLTLLVCGSLFLPVADAAAMEAPALPAPRILAPYPWPAFLARYPVLVTDRSSGDVGCSARAQSP
jgi:hypothetical protein